MGLKKLPIQGLGILAVVLQKRSIFDEIFSIDADVRINCAMQHAQSSCEASAGVASDLTGKWAT